MALENGACNAIVDFVNLHIHLYLVLSGILLHDVKHRIFYNASHGLSGIRDGDVVQRSLAKCGWGIYHHPLLVPPLVPNSASFLCDFDHNYLD